MIKVLSLINKKPVLNKWGVLYKQQLGKQWGVPGVHPGNKSIICITTSPWLANDLTLT